MQHSRFSDISLKKIGLRCILAWHCSMEDRPLYPNSAQLDRQNLPNRGWHRKEAAHRTRRADYGRSDGDPLRWRWTGILEFWNNRTRLLNGKNFLKTGIQHSRGKTHQCYSSKLFRLWLYHFLVSNLNAKGFRLLVRPVEFKLRLSQNVTSYWNNSS